MNAEGRMKKVEIESPVYQLNKNVMTAIWLERLRQKKLFKDKLLSFDCSSPVVSHDRKLRVATEELGEIAQTIDRLETSDCAHRREHLKTEITQLAAVCVAWLESMEAA